MQCNHFIPTLNGTVKLSDYRVTFGIRMWFSMVTVPDEMVGLERMSDYSCFTVFWEQGFRLFC